MKLSKNLKRQVRNAKLNLDQAKKQAGLEQLKSELQKTKATYHQIPTTNVWSQIMKSRITKLSASAAILCFAILIGYTLFNGTDAWAEVIKAFAKVENVHLVQKMIMADGTILEGEAWFKKPNYLCQDNFDSTVIDNGEERLVINKEKKTAQFSDSLMPFQPLEEHWVFDNINVFRSENDDISEVRLFEKQNNGSILVFGFKNGKRTTVNFEGKAWVDAETMLPIKVQVKLTSKPKHNETVSSEFFFDYKPIADDVFAMNIPTGFSELARKQSGVIAGRVVDENQQPLANAIVHFTDRAGSFSEQTRTDKSGQFIFKLPPEAAGKAVWLPVLLRAVVESDPNTIAWSIIKDPAAKYEPGGKIPYEVENLKADGSILRTANGITLTMEPAAKIAGQVTDSDGYPISGANVRLNGCSLSDKYGMTGRSEIHIHRWYTADGLCQSYTDKYGWYEITNVPRLWKKTRFSIGVGAKGFIGESIGFSSKGPLEYEEIDFSLLKPALTVKGRLFDNYGQPIEAASIQISVKGKNLHAKQTLTDKDGFFTLADCPDTPDLQIKAIMSHGINKGSRKGEYFPDVYALIDYEPGKIDYEVEMTTEKPELILNVQVTNTSGELLKYFPVEVRAKSGYISTQWSVDKKLKQRTDENGRCTFTEVPNMDGLMLVLYSGNTVPYEKLDEDAKKYAEENKKIYFWAEVPVDVVEGQKEYDITAIALTREEWKQQKKARSKNSK